MAMLVRLKPYNKKRGHVKRIFMYNNVKYQAEKGWYRVSDADAAFLASVHQIDYDEDSPLAFDVMTQHQAKQVEEAESRAAQERAKASNPIEAAIDKVKETSLTTADLGDKEESPSKRRRRRRREE